MPGLGSKPPTCLPASKETEKKVDDCSPVQGASLVLLKVEDDSCKGDQGELRTAYQLPPPTSTSQPASQPTRPKMGKMRKAPLKKKKKPKAKQDTKPSFVAPPNQRLITGFTFKMGEKEVSLKDYHGMGKEVLVYEGLRAKEIAEIGLPEAGRPPNQMREPKKTSTGVQKCSLDL